MWSAAPPTLEEARNSFDSDNIISTAELSNVLADSAKCANNELTLHTLPSTMEYPALPADASHKALEKLKITQSTEHLLEALHIARLTKTPFEIDLMREANRISSNAHEVLMRTLGLHAQARQEGGKGEKMERTGRELLAEWEVEGETDAEAVFVAACRRQG
jgi:Xaa-Pro dipeptidase